MGCTGFAESDINDIFRIIGRTESEFGITIVKHRKRLDVSQEKLAEHSGLSVATIRRMETGETIRPKIELVIVICIALKLNSIYSFDLIKKSCNIGFFEVFDKTAIAYTRIPEDKDKHTFEYWNNYLKNMGLKPLLKTRDKVEK